MLTLYLDSKFTGLVQNTRLISLAVVAEDGRYFYAESNDFDPVDTWVEQNVIPCLFGDDADALRGFSRVMGLKANGSLVVLRASREEMAANLTTWLESLGEELFVWGDCLAYDWVIFCELFGGARKLPPYVFYIPFDIRTVLLMHGYDPDANLEDVTGLSKINFGRKHNALWDAVVLKACHQKLRGPIG